MMDVVLLLYRELIYLLYYFSCYIYVIIYLFTVEFSDLFKIYFIFCINNITTFIYYTTNYIYKLYLYIIINVCF